MNRTAHRTSCRRLLVHALLFAAALVTPLLPNCAGQESAAPRAPATPGPVGAFFGCIWKSADDFILTSPFEGDASRDYVLSADAFPLSTYEGSQVRVTGLLSHQVDQDVIEVQTIEILHKPYLRKPALKSPWQTFRDTDYGLRVDYPANYEPVDQAPAEPQQNFANPSGVERLFTAVLSRDAYPNTTFAGNTLVVYVSTEITNEPACRAFAQTDVEAMSSRSVDGIRYSQGGYGGAGAGTGYSCDFYHTFRHGFCYEIAFLTAVGSASAYEGSCMFDRVDQDALRNEMLAYVSYFRPAQRKPTALRAKHGSHPEISSFKLAPVVTGPFAGPGTVRIDWSISGGDYVQLRIGCPREAKISVSPLPGGPYMQCFEPGKNLSEFNFPLTDSMILEFTNWADPRAPAQIVLTLQPVLKGVADPRYSKQLTTEAAPARR